MNNIQYIDLIKAKLKKVGYPDGDLDTVARQVISLADEQEVNALVFVESYIIVHQTANFSGDMNKKLNSYNAGMVYTTQRHSKPEPNRFINRQIFDN